MCNCPTHPYDRLNATKYKLALLTDCFSALPEDKQFSLSDKSVVGLYWLLSEAEDAVSAALDHYREV